MFRSRGPILVLATLAVLGAQVGAMRAGATRTGPSGLRRADDAVVHAVVVYVAPGGGASADSTPAIAIPIAAGAGLHLQVVPAGGGDPVGDASTNSDGGADFSLPPGAYWVFVPVEPENAAGLASAALQMLPDGTPAFGWTAVLVVDTTFQTVTIAIMLPIPPVPEGG